MKKGGHTPKRKEGDKGENKGRQGKQARQKGEGTNRRDRNITPKSRKTRQNDGASIIKGVQVVHNEK